MKAVSIKFKTVDEYISAFPGDIKGLLEKLRTMIKAEASEAEEVISYNMPAFRLEGILVYYAGYKGHIGFYPTSSVISVFKEDLTAYKTSKGAIRFPIDKELPSDLIKKMVRYRVKENLEKAKIKSKNKNA